MPAKILEVSTSGRNGLARLIRRSCPWLAAVAASAWLAPGALAHPHVYVPPGNSGAQQYVESVPTASGSRPTLNIHSQPPPGSSASGGGPGGAGGSGGAGSPANGGGASTGGGPAVAPSTRRALARGGHLGRRAAAFALATAPAGVRGLTARSGPAPEPPAAGSGGPSILSQVLDALGGTSGQTGLGLALPLILLLTLVAGIGSALARRQATRRRT